jgi:hypothetical protein
VEDPSEDSTPVTAVMAVMNDFEVAGATELSTIMGNNPIISRSTSAGISLRTLQ